jgi:signal transduction histidine kinase
VSDLVLELGRAPEPGRLRDSLARALRDPSLELAYWVPASELYVGLDGRRVEPSAADGRTVTVLERHGRRIAALVHDPALAEDPALLGAVSTAAGLALENERLLADLRAQLDQLRESRARIVEAGDTERRRLERNLHDGAQQRLVSLSLALGLAESKVEQEPATAVALLQGAREELMLALSELRELARGIHPAVLTERGLHYALTTLAERASVEVVLEVYLDRRPPPAIEAAAYYVVAEALANVAKYAQATTATVSAKMSDERLRVEVADDGVGGADPSAGSGLRGLGDRVQAFGGSLRVVSRPGEGTRILAELPSIVDSRR